MWNLAHSQDTSSSGSRVLAAYFSGTGTTRGVAQNLVNALSTDTATLHEIIPAQPYTSADDVIFLGYPIWNNDAPRII